jgi:hypothetical protein
MDPIARMAGQPPRPHQERGRSQINCGFGGAVVLNVVSVNGGFGAVEHAIIAVELLECVLAVRWARAGEHLERKGPPNLLYDGWR